MNTESGPGQDLRVEGDTLNSWKDRGIEEGLAYVRERFEPESLSALSIEEKEKLFEQARLVINTLHENGMEISDEDSDMEKIAVALQQLDYHKTEHTHGVIEGTKEILRAMKRGGMEITDADMADGEIASAFHDTAQEWEADVVVEGQLKYVRRKRSVGKNEETSAREAEDFLKKANDEAGQEVFGKASMAQVPRAIRGTVPGFDPKLKTVIQPNVAGDASPVERAVAFSDLRTAGMGDLTADNPDGKAEAFLKEGDALFREENLDIRVALVSDKEIPDELKQFFRQRMLRWISFQTDFAAGRKEKVSQEIKALPQGAQEEMHTLFSEFDNIIESARSRAQKVKTLSFDELAREMGYMVA